MKASHILTAAVLLLATTSAARADFILSGNEELTVNTFHSQGVLYGMSRVSIVSGALMYDLYAHDSSAVGVSAKASSRTSPLSNTSPAEGLSSPPRMLSRVLFPDPLGPVTATASRSSREK